MNFVTIDFGLTVEDVRDAPSFADLWDSSIRPFRS